MMKLAIPKGTIADQTSQLLEEVGVRLEDYHGKTRVYRPNVTQPPGVFAKILQEKDIPMQVAVGNYDLGICRSDWAEELLARHPASSLVELRNLGYGERALFVACAESAEWTGVADIVGNGSSSLVRLVSEYPNLAEWFALESRMRHFRVLPVWGAAQAYPPENAELAILAAESEEEVAAMGLRPLHKIMDASACLLANRRRLAEKDLADLLRPLCEGC